MPIPGAGRDPGESPDRWVDVLAEHDDAFLAAWVEQGAATSCARVRTAPATQVGRGAVHPVFFGSAITGAGGGAAHIVAVGGVRGAGGRDPGGPGARVDVGATDPDQREGVLETAFSHYAPVRGPAPARSRIDHNPLDREEHLRLVVRRV